MRYLAAAALAASVAMAGAVLAPSTASKHRPAPGAVPRVVGTWANDQDGSTELAGGYELWSNGTVVALEDAPYRGDAARSGRDDFVGLVTDFWSTGYWLITSTGQVYPFGQVCVDQDLVGPKKVPSTGIVGAIDLSDSDNEGFDLVGANGAIYPFQCQ
jgi:hypothetical protein